MRLFFLNNFVCFLISISSYSQSGKILYTQVRTGIHHDLLLGEMDLGGGLGFGIVSSDSDKRWLGQINLDYFCLNEAEVSEHGFRRISAALQVGRVWPLKIGKGRSISLGGGLLGVTSLMSSKNLWYGGSAAPAGGLFMRAEYPVYLLGNNNFMLVFDSSVFGNGYMRNLLGLSYPLGKK